MKATKLFKKEYPTATFGKIQKAWKCSRDVKAKAPFEEGKLYSGYEGNEGMTHWICVEEGSTPDEAVLQRVFNIDS